VSAFPISPEPFRIEPIFSPRIWGSRSLAPLFPEKTNLAEPIGEAWLTSVDCRIANGPFKGKTLGAAWREMPAYWRGSPFSVAYDFPLLVKFIFPKDKLSIQVHPDDAFASVHEKAAGGRGKTEMWHIVSAEPGAQVLIGLKPGVDKTRFLAALESHTLEQLLEAHPVREGDTFFLPAGTPHTMGSGMIVCEVQQYSDLTYRVYDYGRMDAHGQPRELHIEKALNVINFHSESNGKVATRKLRIRENGSLEELVNCPYFSAGKFETAQHTYFSAKPSTTLRLWVFLEGEGKIGWTSELPGSGGSHDGEFSYTKGECWLIPGGFASHGFYPSKKTSILIASPSSTQVEQNGLSGSK
jgi:mannose-6-phosphate isomerase